MSEKPTATLTPTRYNIPTPIGQGITETPVPPPDHGITEADLNAMTLAQLADLIESNETTYDGLTDTNRNALVRLLRATTEP